MKHVEQISELLYQIPVTSCHPEFNSGSLEIADQACLPKGRSAMTNGKARNDKHFGHPESSKADRLDSGFLRLRIRSAMTNGESPERRG